MVLQRRMAGVSPVPPSAQDLAIFRPVIKTNRRAVQRKHALATGKEVEQFLPRLRRKLKTPFVPPFRPLVARPSYAVQRQHVEIAERTVFSSTETLMNFRFNAHFMQYRRENG